MHNSASDHDLSHVEKAEQLRAFVSRWERRNAVSQKKWSSDAILTEDVTVGMVHIDFLVVHVFGNKTCADVERVGK